MFTERASKASLISAIGFLGPADLFGELKRDHSKRVLDKAANSLDFYLVYGKLTRTVWRISRNVVDAADAGDYRDSQFHFGTRLGAGGRGGGIKIVTVSRAWKRQNYGNYQKQKGLDVKYELSPLSSLF